MHKGIKPLYRVLNIVIAILLLCPAITLAAPDVPGDVTAVAITAPTTAAPAFVKVGAVLPVTFSTDGTGPGTIRYWLGGTIKLAEEAVTLPVAKTMNLTIPADTADGPWDLSVEAKNIDQDNWVAAVQPTSVIVDSTLPVVAADTLIQPNGGEYLQVGSAYDIKWDPAKITEANLAGIDLELWVAGAFHSTIATGLGNTGTFPWTVPAMVTQQAKAKLIAKDKASGAASDESNAFFTIINTDNTPPVVNVTAPLDNAFITANSAVVLATATDVESGITQVVFEYSKDGVAWTAIGTDVAAPYSLDWNVTALPDGTKVWVRATARNGVGASAWDSNANIVIDRSKPAVAITTPTEGALVAGSHMWKADASDAHSGIVGVTFWYSNTVAGWTMDGTDNTAPYEMNVIAPSGPVWVKAAATNGAGLSQESAVVKYMVDATAPAIKATTLIQPNGGEGLQIGLIYTIKWNKADITDANLADEPITLWLTQDGGVTFSQIDGALANTGAYDWKVAGIPSANSWIKIIATDKVGNTASDMSDAAFTIFAVDNTPPTVSITDPTAGAWVTGTKLVKATAADAESGIVQVTFWASTGTWAANPDMAAPFEQGWNTAGYNGDATLKATARNGVGMETTSAVVTVHVDNTPPTVSLQQPVAGNIISGKTFEFIADAADAGSGVASVMFEVQPGCAGAWSTLGTVAAAPYKLVFDTTALPDGTHCFRATAKDKVGLATSTAGVQADVKNTYTIALKAGWNLVSTPLVPYDTNIANVMKNVGAKQVATFIWSGGKLVQQTWIPGVGGTLKTFKDGQGYWVEMPGNGTLVISGRYLSAPPNVLPAYAVNAGWNLIGYTARYNMTNEAAADYLGPSVYNAAQANYAFNPDGDYYYQTWTYNAGLGYWLALSQNGTIYP